MNKRGRFCLRVLTEADLPAVRRFLLQFEYRCTALASLFVRRENPQDFCRFSLPLHNSCFVLEYIPQGDFLPNKTSGILGGLLYYASSGLLYQCLPFMDKEEQKEGFFSGVKFSDTDKEDARFLCTEFFREHKPVSIMGGTTGGLFLESCLRSPVSEARSCTLMFLKTVPEPFLANVFFSVTDKNCGGQYKLRRCTLCEADKLFALMDAYYKEEVLPAGISLNDKNLRLLLHERLKKQLVFAAENESGEYEAMAATTALGMQYARIGGIYTIPNRRRRGLASFLLRCLLSELLKLHYIPVLFVRNVNGGALSVYKKSGFTPCGDYRIAYF